MGVRRYDLESAFRQRHELTDEQKEAVMLDIGRLTVRFHTIKEHIHELRPGGIRSLGRLILHPARSREERPILNKLKGEEILVQHVRTQAEEALEGQLTFNYYEKVQAAYRKIEFAEEAISKHALENIQKLYRHVAFSQSEQLPESHS